MDLEPEVEDQEVRGSPLVNVDETCDNTALM